MKADLFMWFMATLPIILLLLMMVKLKISAGIAAPAGLAVAVAVGVFFFGAGWKLIAVESGKGVWNTLMILLVIWPAILIYEVTNKANAFDVIRRGIQRFSPNELIQVMAVGWVFVSFLQGITGFGVPIAVGAPLLLGLGVRPIWAVVIPLMGQAWGNTFGTLGLAWNALVMQSEIQDKAVINETAFWAGLLILILNLFMGFLMCWFYGKGEAVKKGFLAVLVIGLIQGGCQLLLTQTNAVLSCFVSACLSLLVLFLVGRLKPYREPWKIEDSRMMDRAAARQQAERSDLRPEHPSGLTFKGAMTPYFVLTVLTVLILPIKPIYNALSGWKVGFSFPSTSTGFGIVNHAAELYSPLSPLTNSGTFLLIGALAGYLYFRSRKYIAKGDWKDIVKRTTLTTLPSAQAVLFFVVMSSVMGGSGQTTMLALGVSELTGSFYAFLAPLVGTLGSFITSSNMSSNILFTKFQYSSAQMIGLNEAVILGAQTAGAALGTLIAPGKIIFGTSITGIAGKEGEVLRLMLPIVLILSCLFGIVTFVFRF